MTVSQGFKKSKRVTSLDMTTVFHAWVYDRFMDKKPQDKNRTNQGSYFLGDSLSNRDINLEEQLNPSIVKDDFSSRTDPSIFISITAVLLDWSNQTRWVIPTMKPTSHYLPESAVYWRSDSSSEANSSCCYRSDAWPHLNREYHHQYRLQHHRKHHQEGH